MKKILLPLIFIFSFFSCEKDNFDPGNPSVVKFVQMLNEGKYIATVEDPLPEFKSYDIASLLDHSTSFREIREFPVNPHSSYRPSPYRLGECLLWTIEAIRKSPPTAENLRFPSLAPVLILKDAPEGSDNRLSEAELKEVYLLYENWWNKKGGKTFLELQETDPLEGTKYRWK